MGEAENREVINRLYRQVWMTETPRFDVMTESFSEDAVVEYPQSGERIRGRESIRAAEENYPGLPKVTMRRQLAAGDLVVMETRLDYQGKLYDECSILRASGRHDRPTDDVLRRTLRGSQLSRAVGRKNVSVLLRTPGTPP